MQNIYDFLYTVLDIKQKHISILQPTYLDKSSISYILLHSQDIKHSQQLLQLKINQSLYNDVSQAENYLILLFSSLQYTKIAIPIINRFIDIDKDLYTALYQTFSDIVKQSQNINFKNNFSLLFQSENQNTFNYLTKLSEMLIEIPQLKRQEVLEAQLKNIKIQHTKMFLTEKSFTKIFWKRSKVMKSHAKCPILIATDGGSFIIKAADSVLQDSAILSLQRHLQSLLLKHFSLSLISYAAVPLSINTGYIEVVQNAHSLDEIGNYTKDFFTSFFKNQFCEEQRINWIDSLCVMSIIGYILNYKDRHNGNILLTDDCQLVNIDFGFFFDQAPGGKFTFERTKFKLTKEYIEVIGSYWNYFVDRFTQVMFLMRFAIYDIQQWIRILYGVLPGIKKISSIEYLIDKCMVNIPIQELRKECLKIIGESFENKFSQIYDIFQTFQNDINC